MKKSTKIDVIMDRWWEHSTIKKAGGRQCNGMKMNEVWGLGRGESRRVWIRTNRTTMTMWAEDSDGKGNNNARLASSGLFPAARCSIFVLS